MPPQPTGDAMKRRSRAGGKPTKGRRRKASEPKRRVPNAVARSNSSPTGDKAEVTELSRELNEVREQQTATSEVLQVISSFAGELEPVFRAILANATRICEAKYGNLYLFADGAFRLVAAHSASAAIASERLSSPPIQPAPGTGLGRMLRKKAAVQIADVLTDQGYPHDHPLRSAAEREGVRTLLCVPMIKEDELIGAICIYHQEARPFTDKQVALVKNFATQAVIAIENARLLNELRRRTSDLTEALEQQTATSEVLQVISSSPSDLQLVFETMLAEAVRICDAKFGNIFRRDSEGMHLVAAHNTPPSFAEFRRRSPHTRLIPETFLGRMSMTGAVVHVADIAADQAYTEQRVPETVAAVELGGVRTLLAVPMLKENELIGAFTLLRQEVRPFTEKQTELVKNFAAQAVIAIENARLLNELRQRTNDLTEALEQQTATSEVLQVISSAAGELEPVFAAMLASATRICEAEFGNLLFPEEEAFRWVAWHGEQTDVNTWRGEALIIRTDVTDTPLSRVAATKKRVHIADLRKEAAYEAGFAPLVALVEKGGARTLLIVPMLKELTLIGAIAIYRQDVRPFTDKQIALVENFAAQAVIAIENARLLNELRERTTDLTERTDDLSEALEQQTATSEVLQVISSSPGDLEPVFQAILANATRICGANFGVLNLYEGGAFPVVATHNAPPAYVEQRRRQPMVRPGPSHPLGRVAATKQVLHVADIRTDYRERDASYVAMVNLGGARTLLIVPMLKENDLVGTITIFRQEVRPFTDKQIELVKNFAAQAVIAIENARLLNELREALEQQTATAEVLQVISSSPGDLQPVFATMLENAVRICDAKWGTIHRWDGEALQLMATHNLPPAFAEARSRTALHRPHPKSMFGRMLDSRAAVHFADAASQPAYVERLDPVTIAAVELGAVRTVLGVPMLKENKLIGAFAIARQEVRPFTDKQIELVQNFAAQAVIAIENTRLLNELRDRTAQLEVQSQEVVKLNQHLEQRVADQVGEIERTGRLRRFLPPQVADLIVASGTEKQLESHRREITALFCDLRGFTGFTESADAEDVMALLRDYHAAIGETIIKYSGTLERYAGDGVMVVFNDPVPVEKPALQAVLMALEMREVIGALTEKWYRLGHDIGFGIGIAHGFATLGTIGFEGRFDYAAIGTVSNVASRLCDEAKPGQILISPRVLMAVEDAVTVEPVGEFTLKGIRRPLAAHNVLAAVSAPI
jgi:GAF domain-containing protein